MKIRILALTIIMVSLPTFGQRKSKADPKDVKIDSLTMQVDSLTKSTKNLSLQLDSISGELVKYIGLYNAIKEKVLHYAFDPTRSAYLIDSLQALRDSTSALLVLNQKSPAPLADTIKPTHAVVPVAVIPPVPAEELERAKALGVLKQLKELLDAKIITDAEFVTLKSKYLEKL